MHWREKEAIAMLTASKGRGISVKEAQLNEGASMYTWAVTFKKLLDDGVVELRPNERYYLINEVKIMETQKTVATLRDTLFDEIEAVRNGTSSPSRAKAVSNLADQIIKSAHLELDYHKQAKESDKLPVMGQLLLGSDKDK